MQNQDPHSKARVLNGGSEHRVTEWKTGCKHKIGKVKVGQVVKGLECQNEEAGSDFVGIDEEEPL